MTKPSSVVGKLSKTALLASAAIGLPSAHATVFYSSGPINLKSSDTNPADAVGFLNVDAGSAGDLGNDFSFTASYTGRIDTVTAAAGNFWLGNGGTPTALTAGSAIGPASTTWTGGTGTLQVTQFDSVETNTFKMKGPWPKNGSAYLGLQFAAADGTHYGWAQIAACTYDDSNACDPSSTISIIDWAYQSDPGVSIQAAQGQTPEPSSLALFALGAAGLAAFRLRRKKAA